MKKDGEWDGFDPGGGRVVSFVCSQHTGEPKICLTQGVVPGIRAPHAGKRLAHRAEVHFDYLFLDNSSSQGEFTCLHSMCKVL